MAAPDADVPPDALVDTRVDAGAPPAAGAAPGSAPPSRLLLVDDDRLMRGMAARTLRHAGFQVLEADSGEQALALVAETAADLVLLDVMMDGIDGFETCRRLRLLPHLAEVPVLMLTGLNDTESIETSYRAGATDFITKPIHWALLAHRVRYALRASAERSALAHSRASLVRAQRLAHMGSWEIGSDGALHCSDELARIFGATGDSGPCLDTAGFLGRVCLPDRDRVERVRAMALREGLPYQISYAIERFDGAVRSLSEQAVPRRDGTGRLLGLEGITQDVTERIEAERQVRQLALYDGLTGLPNRQLFLELASAALDRGRASGSQCAVVHLDIDSFKLVNDALGRSGGDLALRALADRLQALCRADGAVGAPATPARISANGFGLLLPGLGPLDDGAPTIERLLRELARPLLLAGRELVLTASAGIAMFPRDGGTAAELAGHAEQALYAAKKAGRGQMCWFDAGLNREARARLVRETELRRAIEQGELRLHFQPKVDALRRQIVGTEALVRWQHPRSGLVAPAEFIPLAEETGLIRPLTDWVLDAACQALVAWRGAGVPLVPVAVNVASPSFMADGLIAQLEALLARHQLAPDLLMIEVTESMLMTDTDRAIARMQALRERGFRLSLDDFGTGYSSLSYVKRFPIDELKIDRSFVRDVQRGGKDLALVASIVTLARLLELQLVAEGVETEQQATILRDLGCEAQQGFLYSRPVPADALSEWLRRSAPPTGGLR